MNTFSGNITKEVLLKEIIWHREQDMLVPGTYGNQNGSWHGCAVACALRSIDKIKGEELQEKYNQHKRYESELGIPEWIAYLEDALFEGMNKKDRLLFPEELIESIAIGVTEKQLEVVKWKFCSELLRGNIERVRELPNLDEDIRNQVIAANEQVLQVHQTAIASGLWDKKAAYSAARSADSSYSAAYSAVYSADSSYSAAYSAVDSADSADSAADSTYSAADSARSAAYSAAYSARSAAGSAYSAAHSARSVVYSADSAYSAAYSAAYKKYADHLIVLLKEVKPENNIN